MFQPRTECVDSLTIDDVTGQAVPSCGGPSPNPVGFEILRNKDVIDSVSAVITVHSQRIMYSWCGPNGTPG